MSTRGVSLRKALIAPIDCHAGCTYGLSKHRRIARIGEHHVSLGVERRHGLEVELPAMQFDVDVLLKADDAFRRLPVGPLAQIGETDDKELFTDGREQL